ncbi:replicative DNA helicase [Aeromonas enteropelogenes]|uniref:replicative DNA helicase n=1 Tax=Aeromonas enteropelogenes TaxID=29489 RepID=UPI003BA2604C
MNTYPAGLVPPHSFDAEQSLLGGVMLRSDRFGDLTVSESDFYSRPHRLIFSAMAELYAAQQPVDLVVLQERLESKGELDEAGGFTYLVEIAKNTPSAANLLVYDRIVRDHSHRRFAIAKLYDALEAMTSTDLTAVDDRFAALNGLISEVDTKRAGGVSGLAVPASEIVLEWCDELERRYNRRPGELTGISTGIPSLDALLYPKGISQTALVVIGARPKMGKTSVLAAMCNHAALERKLPVVGFSLEMTRAELFEVMVSQASGVASHHFSTLKDQELVDKGYSVAAQLGQSMLYLADAPSISVHQVIRESRRLRREHGQLGLIAVDYLTLMTADKAERNDLAFGAITKALKQLAKEMRCPVVLLAQLNRQLEQRADKRPIPSDSRDTGQIEQDCDVWIGLYRDEVYHEDTPYRGLMELLVRLNRGGKTGSAHVGFHEGVIKAIDEGEVHRMAAEADAAAQQQTAPRRREY